MSPRKGFQGSFQDSSPRELPKRDSQESSTKDMFKRYFRWRFPREIRTRRSHVNVCFQMFVKESCPRNISKRGFQESFPRELPKRDAQDSLVDRVSHDTFPTDIFRKNDQDSFQESYPRKHSKRPSRWSFSREKSNIYFEYVSLGILKDRYSREIFKKVFQETSKNVVLESYPKTCSKRCLQDEVTR